MSPNIASELQGMEDKIYPPEVGSFCSLFTTTDTLFSRWLYF